MKKKASRTARTVTKKPRKTKTPSRGGSASAREPPPDEHFEASLKSVPKSLVERLTGRQFKTLGEQSDLYGLPFKADSIRLAAELYRSTARDEQERSRYEVSVMRDGEPLANLFVLLRWFEDRLCHYGPLERQLKEDGDDGGENADPDSLPALIKENHKKKNQKLAEEIRKLKYQNAEISGKLVKRETIRHTLALIAKELQEMSADLAELGPSVLGRVLVMHSRIETYVEQLNARADEASPPVDRPNDTGGTALVSESLEASEAADDHPVRRRRNRTRKGTIHKGSPPRRKN